MKVGFLTLHHFDPAQPLCSTSNIWLRTKGLAADSLCALILKRYSLLLLQKFVRWFIIYILLRRLFLMVLMMLNRLELSLLCDWSQFHTSWLQGRCRRNHMLILGHWFVFSCVGLDLWSTLQWRESFSAQTWADPILFHLFALWLLILASMSHLLYNYRFRNII